MQDLIKELREHNDPRLYIEADLLMIDAADLIESQAAFIENLQSLWTIAHNERSEAMLELAKERSVCDQMGNALNRLFKAAPGTIECNNMHHPKQYQHAYDETCQMVSEYYEALEQARSALESWRAMK